MNYFIYTGLLAGVLVVTILLIYGVKAQSNNWFLAGGLCCLMYSLIATWLISSGKIASVPYLARVGNIFGYMVFPFFFLFARNTFYPGRLWQKADFIFFLPALFYIVDMFPFFLSPAAEKIGLIRHNLNAMREVYKAKEGWILPAGFHYVFRALWSGFLYSLMAKMIYNNWRYEMKTIKSNNMEVFRFILMFVLLFLSLVLLLLYGTISRSSWWDMHFFSFILCCPFIGSGLFLLYSPGVIYGFRPLIYVNPLHAVSPEPSITSSSEAGKFAAVETAEGQENLKDETFDDGVLSKYVESLISYMDTGLPYKRSGLTIHKLAELSGIPVYIISYIVNHRFNSNFNTWINSYRIRYFMTLSQDSSCGNYSMEALSEKAGFTNRVTFSNVFKKETGESPAKYLKSILKTRIKS